MFIFKKIGLVLAIPSLVFMGGNALKAEEISVTTYTVDSDGAKQVIEQQTIKIIKGMVQVMDGDTFLLDDGVELHAIRLFGIDAPELYQDCYDLNDKVWPCGYVAKFKLESLIDDKAISCQTHEKDSHDRWIATCYDANGNVLNKKMVAAGYAVVYRHYTANYLQEENEAKWQGLGIWQDPNFIMPWQWRKDNQG